MSNFIFLTENNADETMYYAISETEIETLKICETYSSYGQPVGHYDAGDYHFNNSASDAQSDCIAAIREKFGIEADEEIVFEETNDAWVLDEDNSYIGDAEDGYTLTEGKVSAINEFIETWRSENEIEYECEGFNYWDGHNWQTVVTSNSYDDNTTTHTIVDDEDLINALNSAIENKEFDSEGHGFRAYKCKEWNIIVSQWQGTWEAYRIEERDWYSEGYEAVKYRDLDSDIWNEAHEQIAEFDEDYVDENEVEAAIVGGLDVDEYYTFMYREEDGNLIVLNKKGNTVLK